MNGRPVQPVRAFLYLRSTRAHLSTHKKMVGQVGQAGRRYVGFGALQQILTG